MACSRIDNNVTQAVLCRSSAIDRTDIAAMQTSHTKQRTSTVPPTKSASATTKTLITSTSTSTALTARRPAAHLASALMKRKALIDINAASYNVKDPHAAIDTLRALLGALSARPGSTQLRMTPDERTLAVRLVGIIEPVRFKL